MKRLKALAAVVGAVLMFTTRAAYADMANGSYSSDFSGEVPVWDISGEYSGDAGLGLGLDFSISEDPSGNFTGAGTFDYDDGSGDVLDGDISVSGTVKGSATNPRVSMNMLISGTGTVVVDQDGDTDDVTYAASAKISFGIDSDNGELAVTSGSISVKETDLTTGKTKSRSAPLGKGATMAMPVESTGDWNLTLNLTPNGTQYTGTATVGTSTGGTAEFTATGSYKSKTDTSKITLKGTNGSVSLVISTSGSVVNIQSVKGKLFGQSLKFKAP